MSNLVIVESPSKATTIKGYLGSNYKVIASVGHVRDLPKSTLGVDIENGFEPHYINIRGKGDLIKEIKKEAKNANKVYLATDPDREGEAISWHLATTLGIPVDKTLRVTFNEVTKNAVKAAIKSPRHIDMNLVDAQQTRRILDRIVGYKLSPYLWKTVKSGLSAGRVQSVATKIIVDRENEIKEFVPVEYWTIDAVLASDKGDIPVKYYGENDKKVKIENEEAMLAVVNDVKGKQFNVKEVKKSVRHRMPAPPFITSTLLQEAFKKLNFQSARTMKVAQDLYEGINIGSENGGMQGLITYMRTDSQRISAEAQEAAASYIKEKYGEKYYPSTPRVYKSGNDSQDAHEAIRPSNVNITPSVAKKYMTADQYKLYKLIWERFIASQMESADLNTVTADFESEGHLFRTSGYTVTFNGFMAVYVEEKDEDAANKDEDEINDIKIPEIKEGEKLDCKSISGDKHMTEAPPRYNEATLMKFLKEKGIGRPSTYTPIITTIIARNYVKREGKSLVPTPLGEMTTQLMNDNFADIVNYHFTVEMENDLDGIENGTVVMNEVLNDFWGDFKKELDAAEKNSAEGKLTPPPEETDIICEKCGSRMVVKVGKFGKFAACPNYPECKNTKPLDSAGKNGDDDGEKTEKKLETADFKCELCGGDMVLRTGRYGSFYACVNYPKCKFTKQKVKEIDVKCPKCGSKVVIKHGKNKTVFYSCEKYPECDFSSWDMPTKEKCPVCGEMLYKHKGKDTLYCKNPECKYESEKNEKA